MTEKKGYREGHHYSLDSTGRFWRTKEASWIDLPCTIRSSAGWHVEVTTLDELRACLERHHSEKGVIFDLEVVWEWASERELECQKNYSAFIAPSKNANALQGVYPGFEMF